ncbi:MAG: NADPH:quinone reductase, partial [Armatimonadetes bacterium]|nr:NADPH:quinone reductase [Armatimonadota bacterium]
EEIDSPELGDGDVIVALKAAGVNPVDSYIRAGTYGERPRPYTPGMDGAGTVEAVCPGLGGIAVGDRVYVTGSLTGTYAEKTVALASDVHPLPERVTFEQGASIGVPYPTAYRALFQKARAIAGEWLLVHGCSGGVGTAALQWARPAGLRIVGTAGSENGAALARENGAHHVVDHTKEGYLEEAVAATGGHGFDVILEMLANVNLPSDLEVLAQGGRVVLIGNRGRVEIDPRAAMRKDAVIYGMVLFNAPPAEMAALHAAVGAGLEAGLLRPHVGRALTLEDAPKAHHAVMGRGAAGKIVLKM